MQQEKDLSRSSPGDEGDEEDVDDDEEEEEEESSESSGASSDKSPERHLHSASHQRVLLTQERRLQRLMSLRQFPLTACAPFATPTAPLMTSSSSAASAFSDMPLTQPLRFAAKDVIDEDDALLLQLFHRHDTFQSLLKLCVECRKAEDRRDPGSSGATEQQENEERHLSLEDVLRRVSPGFSRAFPAAPSPGSGGGVDEGGRAAAGLQRLPRPELIAAVAMKYLQSEETGELEEQRPSMLRKRSREDDPEQKSSPATIIVAPQIVDTSATGGLVGASHELWQRHLETTAAAEGISVKALRQPATVGQQFADRQSFIERVHARERAELLRLEKIAEDQSRRRAERRYGGGAR